MIDGKKITIICAGCGLPVPVVAQEEIDHDRVFCARCGVVTAYRSGRYIERLPGWETMPTLLDAKARGRKLGNLISALRRRRKKNT